MTKQTYLRRLRRALKGVPSRERENCIDYYAELIDDAFERGKTAREVFNELEAPEEAAEKLKGELSHRGYDYDDRDYFDDDRDYRRARDYDDYDDRRRDYDRDRDREREQDRRDREREQDRRDREREQDRRDRERELDRRERELDRRELDRRERELDRREHDRRERELDRRERELERREYENDRRKRERDYERDDDDEEEDEVNEKPSFPARLVGVLIGLPLGFGVLILVISLFCTALSLVVSGAYLVIFSVGLMFSSIVSGLIQLGMGLATLAIGALIFTLLSPIARILWGITGWIFRGFCKSNKPEKEHKKFKISRFAAWLAVFAVGSVIFVAAYGSVGFDHRRIAVTDDVETLEWTLDWSLEDEYDDLKIDLKNFALHVESGEVEKPVFEYSQLKESPKKFSYEEGVVVVSYENYNNTWLGNLRNQWKRGIFYRALTPEIDNMTLILPSGYSGNFEVKSQNGAVVLEGLTLENVELVLGNGAMKASACTFETFTVTADNGAVSIEKVNAEIVAFKSRNGLVNAESVEATTVTVETDNGAIKLTDVNAAVLDLKSDNGAVKIERATAERVSAETDNGYIGVNRVDAQELTLTARNGRIAGELAGNLEDYSIDAQTQNGSCNLSNRTEGERTLYVRTRNGAIHITFYGN